MGYIQQIFDKFLHNIRLIHEEKWINVLYKPRGEAELFIMNKSRSAAELFMMKINHEAKLSDLCYVKPDSEGFKIIIP